MHKVYCKAPIGLSSLASATSRLSLPVTPIILPLLGNSAERLFEVLIIRAKVLELAEYLSIWRGSHRKTLLIENREPLHYFSIASLETLMTMYHPTKMLR